MIQRRFNIIVAKEPVKQLCLSVPKKFNMMKVFVFSSIGKNLKLIKSVTTLMWLSYTYVIVLRFVQILYFVFSFYNAIFWFILQDGAPFAGLAPPMR